MNLVSLIFPLILLGVMIAWGFLIGKRNVIIRIIGVWISFAAALICVTIVKNLGFSGVSPLLEALLAGSEMGDEILDFFASAEGLGDALMSVTTAFAAPVVFMGAFIFFAIVTWIIGLIVSIICMIVKPDVEKKRSPGVIIPCVIAQVLLTSFVLLTPVAAYGGVVNEVAQHADIAWEDAGTEEVIGLIDAYESTPAVAVYRITGGKVFCKWLTSFKIGGEKSNLANEAGSLGRVLGNVIYLSSSNISEYGDDEANAIRDLSEGVSDSVLLPALTGEVIYSATDAWLADEEFFGVPAPDMNKAGAAIFDETFTHILEIFHKDAREHDAFCADIDTVANIVVILAEDGIFRAMGDDGDSLIDVLCSGETVRKLVAEFGANESFKVLIGDVTNIGMRAIGSALKIPENAEEVYSEFTGSIAEELTCLNNSGKSDEEKCAELAEVIKNAFDESGIDAVLDDEVVKLYAKMILEDFGSYQEVTKEDISEFFRAYSEVSRAIDPDSVKVENSNYEYTSAAYANKSLDEIRTQSGAGLLAEILNRAVEANANGTSDEIKSIVEDACADYVMASGKDADAAKSFSDSLDLSPESLTQELISATASCYSSETMAEVSTVVTVAELLVDSKSYAESLDSAEAVEKEAEALGNVFNSVGDIASVIGESDMNIDSLSNVAENLGAVLDNLSETGAIGEENTGKLMTAVMQSGSVRDAAGLDMNTATEIAKAATESEDGKVSYKETMTGIAAGASVADKLTDENEELTREDIRELLDSMNPQTAKVLNAYMTEKRVAGFGVPESKVSISTTMINNLLTEMGDKEKYSSDYESEIDGITTLFDLLNAATAKNEDGKAIFNHGDEKGIIDSDAYGFTGTILASDMVCNSLEKSLNKDGAMILDPFGLNLNENGKDYNAVNDALDQHYRETADSRVELIRALFGIK